MGGGKETNYGECLREKTSSPYNTTQLRLWLLGNGFQFWTRSQELMTRVTRQWHRNVRGSKRWWHKNQPLLSLIIHTLFLHDGGQRHNTCILCFKDLSSPLDTSSSHHNHSKHRRWWQTAERELWANQRGLAPTRWAGVYEDFVKMMIIQSKSKYL